VSNTTDRIGAKKPAQSEKSKKLSRQKRLLRFFDRSGHFLGRFGISYSGVSVMSCNHPVDSTGSETDSSLVFEKLDPGDIPKLKEHRDESVVRSRLENGYICHVIKNHEGQIDHAAWFTNRPYFCWPVRTVIDPGPRGWYWFDAYTMFHARRRQRFSQNVVAWYNAQPPGTQPIVSAVSLWNEAAYRGHLKLGFHEVCRIYCVSLLGFKFFRVRRLLPESSCQWLVRSRGKNLTYDAGTLRIY